MAEFRSIRNDVPLKGEKPVINDKFPTHVPAFFRANETPVAKAEKPEKKKHGSTKLRDGIRLFNLKRWESALKDLLQVDAEDFSQEERSELAYYLGLCCTKLERYDDAILYLEQVVTGGNDLLRAYQCRMTLAYIYAITGRVKMAEFELKRLQNAGFESASLYNTLGYAAYCQKRYRNAIELYEKALELDRNNATALNGMGYILADTGMDAARGLKYCRKALEIRPRNAAYLDSLGWANFKCGELAEARSLLRRAIDLAPGEKEIRTHYRIITGESTSPGESM